MEASQTPDPNAPQDAPQGASQDTAALQQELQAARAAAAQQQQELQAAQQQLQAAREAAAVQQGLQAAREAAGQRPGQTAPQVPHLDHTPETPEEVQALATAFAEFRKEVAQLRNELQAARQPQRFQAAVTETLEQRTARRLQEVAQHSHYCPACGLLYDYPQKCAGPVAAPHIPHEVVTTDELSGDPASHTAAPNTDVLALA